MKITVDIDCTPEEARAFFGLPDLAPVHEMYVEKMKGLISDGLSPADLDKMTRAWLPQARTVPTTRSSIHPPLPRPSRPMTTGPGPLNSMNAAT